MDSRSKAVKTHRKRLRTRGMKRVEITVPTRAAEFVRRIASVLRAEGPQAERLISELRQITGQAEERSAAEVMDAAPDISGSRFDHAFEEIERLRHDPETQRARQIDL